MDVSITRDERCRLSGPNDLGVTSVGMQLNEDIPVTLVLRHVKAQFCDLHPVVSFCLPTCLRVGYGSCEIVQPNELAYCFKKTYSRIVCQILSISRLGILYETIQWSSNMNTMCMAHFSEGGTARVSFKYSIAMINANWLLFVVFGIRLSVSMVMNFTGLLRPERDLDVVFQSHSLGCAIPATGQGGVYVLDHVRPIFIASHGVVQSAFCRVSGYLWVV